jgi:hypothetical protein
MSLAVIMDASPPEGISNVDKSQTFAPNPASARLTHGVEASYRMEIDTSLVHTKSLPAFYNTSFHGCLPPPPVPQLDFGPKQRSHSANEIFEQGACNQTASSGSDPLASPNPFIHKHESTLYASYSSSDSLISLEYPPEYHCGSIQTHTHPSTDLGGPLSLSLAERRERNKTASAKYRAKKQMKQQEMREMIQHLTEENQNLSQLLEIAQREVEEYKIRCLELEKSLSEATSHRKAKGATL